MSEPRTGAENQAAPVLLSRRQALGAFVGLSVGVVGVTGCGRRRRRFSPFRGRPRSEPTRSAD